MSIFGQVRSLIAFAAFTVFALTPNAAFAQRGGHGGGGGGGGGFHGGGGGGGFHGGGGGVASMAVEAVAAFMAAGVEDSTAVALPVAVAGFPMVADIVAATPTGACARMAAEHDLLVAEVITGAVVFGADRRQAGAPTAASVPRAA